MSEFHEAMLDQVRERGDSLLADLDRVLAVGPEAAKLFLERLNAEERSALDRAIIRDEAHKDWLRGRGEAGRQA